MATSSTSFFKALVRIKDATKLNIGGMGLTINKEIIIHFNDNNCSIVKERPIDIRNIALLNYPQRIHFRNIFKGNQATDLPELDWINNDIQSIVVHFDWWWKDVMEALVEKRYDKKEFKESNIFFELCILIGRVCSFNTENFFTFYRMIIENIDVKPPFTPFEWLVLRLLKVAPS